MEILWWCLLALAAVFFIAMHAVVFPLLFFRVRFEAPAVGRGVRVVGEPDGASIVYEPEVGIRKYVYQYIVSRRGGKKRMIMRIADRLKYIAYDVALYDAGDKMFRLLHVEEIVAHSGYTAELELPDETAYVMLYLNAADGEKFKSRLHGKVSGKKWAAFLVCAAATECVSFFLGKLCFAKLFGGIYWESYLFSVPGNALTALLCLAVVAVNALIMLLYVRFKVVKRDRRG